MDKTQKIGTERLKVAVQKRGRLSEDSLQLLKECGISIGTSKHKLIASAKNFPIDILYLRADDIPQYVEDGIADIGIVGENTVCEVNKNITIVQRLGFAKCRLSLAIPKNQTYEGVSFFHQKKIATSYPHILQNFLASHNVLAEIHKISGSVEIAPSIGLADAVCDIVSTGSTLLSNGLKEVVSILSSEAVLVAYPSLIGSKQAILDQLLFRIDTVQQAKSNRYILLNAPNEVLPKIQELLPGMKSPTVIPLAEEGWSAIHSVIHEEHFWEIIDSLKTLGAEGILVVPIEKMVV